MDPFDEPAPVDTDLLRRHPDPGVAVRREVTVEEPPVRRGIDAA
jgi:hypothetical protein